MNPTQSTRYLSVLRLNRRQALQLLFVAVLLGAGVNLVAAWIGDQLKGAGEILLGLGLTFSALIFLAGKAFWPPRQGSTLSGFFIYDRRGNTVAEADIRYGLAYNLKRYIDAAFAENKAMQAMWDDNPLAHLSASAEEKQGDPAKSLEIIRQAVEYYALSDFSTAMNDYFRKGTFKEDELETLSHTDIPNVLLQNRFMKLFAEPMEERSAFLGRQPHPSSSAATIVSAGTSDGALYQRFQLVLPKGWKVERSDARRIVILTPRFKLTLATDCSGLAVNTPTLYAEHYLGLGPLLDDEGVRYSSLKVDVSVQIAPKKTWLVTPGSWKYYQWIDNWLQRLESNISQELYFRNIGWEAAETAYRLNGPCSHPSEPTNNSAASEPSASQAELKSESGSTQYRVGDRVEHATFGLGEVIATEPGGVAVVRFDEDPTGADSRKLMWDYAPIRLIDRGRPLD